MTVSQQSEVTYRDYVHLSAGEIYELFRSIEGDDFDESQCLLNLCVCISHPGGTQTCFTVHARRLTTNQIHFIHGGYLNLGTRCELRRSPDASEILEGTVTNCKHIRGLIHEIEMTFDRSTSSNALIDDDSKTDRDIKGSLICVDSCKIECDLLNYRLRSTNIDAIFEQSVSGTIKLTKRQQCQILIANVDSCGDQLPDLIQSAQSWNPSVSCLLLVTDTPTAKLANYVEETGCCVLMKPYEPQQLIDALRECCRSIALVSSVAFSGITDDIPLEIVNAYIDEARNCGEQLRTAIGDRQFKEARQICVKVKATAKMFGFPELGQIACDAYMALEMTGKIQESLTDLNRLQSACSGLYIPGAEAKT